MSNSCITDHPDIITPHVFRLPSPNGHEALGVCEVCGFEKMHYNSDTDTSNPWQKTKEATWKTRVVAKGRNINLL